MGLRDFGIGFSRTPEVRKCAPATLMERRVKRQICGDRSRD
jgi:hypothetical protein